MPRTGRVVGILVVIWMVAGGIIWSVRSSRPTPEKMEAYLAAHPLASAPAADRPGIIDHIAGQLNGLKFEDRQQLQRTGVMRTFFESMTNEERNAYLDRTLPEGFRQVMLALNKMTPEKRKEIVERALANIKKGRPDAANRPSPIDDAMMHKIVAQGMTSFYEDANASVKLDFAPVIEQIQQSLQWRN